MQTIQKLSFVPVFTQSGLTYGQALVYETLIKNGPLKAGKIYQKTTLKRGLVYKILEELEKLGLVEKKENLGKVAVFIPQHPFKLKELAEKQEQKAKAAQALLEANLGQLSSDFNLISGMPGVRFYEGTEGIIKIYEKILNTQKNIDSIEDKGEMAMLIPAYAKKFISTRIRKKIFNRVIAPSQNPINPSSQKELRETHFLPVETFPFRMDIKISGNLVSLITLQKTSPIGILVESQEIAENFQMLFELLWKLTALKPPAPKPT